MLIAQYKDERPQIFGSVKSLSDYYKIPKHVFYYQFTVLKKEWFKTGNLLVWNKTEVIRKTRS